MAENKDELLHDLQALFAKHNIDHAFLAIPKIEEEYYLLLPFQMGNNAIRHMAASLLQNFEPLPPATLN
jgi:hypothetical protein